MIDSVRPRFRIGEVVATPGAMEAMDRTQTAPHELIGRHGKGDWGDVCEEDAEANEVALKDGARIFSVYHLKDATKVYVITEADRSSTCILLPEEY